MANERELVVKFIGDTKSLNTAIEGTTGTTNKLGAAVKSAGTAFVAVAAADVAVDFLKDATSAAEDDEKAQKILATTVKNTTGATDAQVASMEKWINKTQNATGILDDHLRPALQNLVVATGSVEEAESQMQIAMDISTAKGIDLETVTQAMAKAHDGNTGALARVGIETKNTAGETLSYDEILKNAAETMGGATAAAADTTAGKMAILKAKFEDIKENIGTALIPILADLATFMVDKVIPAADQVVQWWEQHWPAIDSAIQHTLDVVVPIFEQIGTAIATGVNTALAVVQPLVDILHGDWGKAWDDFRDRIRGVWEGITGLIRGQVDAILGIVGGLISGVKHAVNAVIDAWNGFVGHLGIHVSVFGKNFDWDPGDSLKIPHLDTGGTILGTGLAVVHKGETVVPAGGGMGHTFNIATVNVTANNPQQLVSQLQDYARRNGGLRLSGGVTTVS